MEVLLRMIIGVAIWTNGLARDILNSWHIVGRERALELWRGGHDGVSLTRRPVALALGSVLRDVLEVEGMTEGGGTMANRAKVLVKLRRGSVDRR